MYKWIKKIWVKRDKKIGIFFISFSSNFLSFFWKKAYSEIKYTLIRFYVRKLLGDWEAEYSRFISSLSKVVFSGYTSEPKQGLR